MKPFQLLFRSSYTAALVLLLGAGIAAAGETAPASPQPSAPATVGDDPTPGDPHPGSPNPGSADPGDPNQHKQFFQTTTVTATLSEVDEFEIPMSVSVVDEVEHRPEANTATDLLLTEPGISANGIGANQTRPIIRGQRGLRILFLENGLSVNNPRRQTDFGEITGMIDLDEVDSVEVVRGPASVLYGSGGIGGVLNVITKDAYIGSGSPFIAGLSLRDSSADSQEKGSAYVAGYTGRFGYRLQASVRDAEDYKAASGTFGAVHLADEARVFDSGVKDDNQRLELRYRITDRQDLMLETSRYHADQFGFGFVSPELIDPNFDGTSTRILYPFQDFDRTTLEWSGGGGPLDSFTLRLFDQSNKRELTFDADINIGPLFPGAPPSAVELDTLNFTDLGTTGARGEATKSVGTKQVFTFGFDWTDDDSFNTDNATTVTRLRFPFPVPPQGCDDQATPFECDFISEDPIANTPNAKNTSLGIFVQNEIQATRSFALILGARYQNVDTKAEATPQLDTADLDFTDDQVVGSASLLYALNDHFELVGTLGTAFRAPSIIERLFNGPTPEGTGYQILNPDLVSENSDYYDLGFKYRSRRAYAQLSYFENKIDNGVIQHFLSDAEIGQLDPATQQAIQSSGAVFVVQQRNIDRVTFEGVEVSGGYRFDNGVSLGGNYSHLDGRRFDSDQPPTGDVAGDVGNAWARYERRRWSLEYRVRYNGEENAVIEPGDPVPVIGETLPSFTIHTLSGFGTLYSTSRLEHELGLVIDNLTDELYAEFSNIGSFRPAPKRNFIVTYRLKVK